MLGVPPVNAFVLQRTPYRENSLLLRLFMPEYGQTMAVWRGTATTHLYQPYHFTLAIKDDWATVRSVELAGKVLHLRGPSLYMALYLNELLGLLLPRWAPATELFGAYYATLRRLEAGEATEPLLRFFERRLLEQLGVGIDFQRDTAGHTILSDTRYDFDGRNGFVPMAEGSFSGAQLAAVEHNQWQVPGALLAAKRLFRAALAVQLDGKPLRSRAYVSPLSTGDHSPRADTTTPEWKAAL
ncbi:DNA repair protein RecO [Salinispirillum marinum]|uniref:DNA repair protein RecO n=2 Tax=Saccharospirillaceae TaxID=255527 RepID=A0ABV8BH68_9GAMM